MIFFHDGRLSDANNLVIKYHYSHRGIPKQNVKVVGTWHYAGGLNGDCGRPIAACILGRPAARWRESSVVELVRLVRIEENIPPLTGLISETLAVARKFYGIDLVISYADSTFNHHGGVYQAASFNYHGKTAVRMDGVVTESGRFIPGRSMNHSRFRTQSPKKLESLGTTVTAHYDKGKYLYWRALTKGGKQQAERMGLRSLPYVRES